MRMRNKSLILGDHSITGATSEKVSWSFGTMCLQDLLVYFVARRLDPSATDHCFHECLAPSMDVGRTRQPSQSTFLVYSESCDGSVRQEGSTSGSSIGEQS